MNSADMRQVWKRLARGGVAIATYRRNSSVSSGARFGKIPRIDEVAHAVDGIRELLPEGISLWSPPGTHGQTVFYMYGADGFDTRTGVCYLRKDVPERDAVETQPIELDLEQYAPCTAQRVLAEAQRFIDRPAMQGCKL